MLSRLRCNICLCLLSLGTAAVTHALCLAAPLAPGLGPTCPSTLLLLAVAAMASGVERLLVLWLLPWLLLGGHEEEAPPSAWDEVGEIEIPSGTGPLGSSSMPSTTSSLPYTYENITMYMLSAWDENISIGLQEEEIAEVALPPPGPHEVPLPTWSLTPPMEHAPEVSSATWWTPTPTSSSWTSSSSSTAPHVECPEQDHAGVNPELTTPPEVSHQERGGKHATSVGLVGGDQGHPCSSTRRS